MRKDNVYYPLKWHVECRWPNSPLWETIAAFNHRIVANNYARASWIDKPDAGWQYRVMERTGRSRWIEVDIYKDSLDVKD